MSEKMLRVNVSELTTFRIACLKCKRGVVEVRVDRLDAALDGHGQCRLCKHEHFADPSADPFNGLKIALQDLQRLKDTLAVEFDLPAPG
jgi:hypothetical protein